MLAPMLAVEGYVITVIVLLCSFVGMVFAALYAKATYAVPVHLDEAQEKSANEHLLVHENGNAQEAIYAKVRNISDAIAEGANAFLFREYVYMGVFMVGFTVIIIVLIGASTKNWVNAIFTAIAFDVGAATSILSGFIGMKIAVVANSRTALEAQRAAGFERAFNVAFKAGAVMGFALNSFGVLLLYILMNFFRLHYSDWQSDITGETVAEFFEAVAGYGLGGSSIALFGRVGGGIYTKAADVGADLCGKLEFDIPEDDPRNPAVIADNVGDNVGDVAGMGADLFGSFAEASCAAMVVTAESVSLRTEWSYLCFPLLITSTGILVCLVTSFVATHLILVKQKQDIEPSLKRQLLVSTILATPVHFVLCWYFLPSTISFVSTATNVKNWHVFICVAMGLWAGLLIGYITEYYTSHAYTPVREVSQSCESGAATNIIYGLAVGYKSVIIPAMALCATIYTSYTLAAMYGVAVSALGILSTLAIGLTIDAYGPICDNAGGIAEMAGMGPDVRARTDALDAAGNTTAAIGKGFAIGSAALVSLALFGGFLTITKLGTVLHPLDLLDGFVYAGLLFGAMLPYWFSAMTMKSVGKAALAMVQEVRDQFEKNPGILEGTVKPDYSRCVDISTQASLRAMIPPGALVMLTPLIIGYLFGVKALAGVLAGSLVSGVQMAISSSNSGGAWDNAKKYIEEGHFGGKGSETHKAAVVGDTVGDPLKDTSGPSLNILIKLMAIISLVFARSFASPNTGGLIQQIFN
jgi:H+-translocating diphosphatase